MRIDKNTHTSCFFSFYAALLFIVAGVAITLSGLFLLLFDFSRDALAVPPAGYRQLEVNEDTSERSDVITSAQSSDSSFSSTRARVADPAHKHTA